MPLKPITILLAEDHDVVRQGLCSLLNTDGHFIVIGEARTGREAITLAHKLRPDVILMDIAMPELNGLEATRQILAANPSAKIAILSAHSDDEYIERLAQAGAVGFLEKQTSAEILSKALHEIAKGHKFLSPSLVKRLRTSPPPPRDRLGQIQTRTPRLTSREAEVLQLVAEGSANKQIASKLCISIKTVEKHRQQLMDKLNIHDTAGLTRFAISTGVIEGNIKVTIT